MGMLHVACVLVDNLCKTCIRSGTAKSCRATTFIRVSQVVCLDKHISKNAYAIDFFWFKNPCLTLTMTFNLTCWIVLFTNAFCNIRLRHVILYRRHRAFHPSSCMGDVKISYCNRVWHFKPALVCKVWGAANEMCFFVQLRSASQGKDPWS